MLIRVQSNAFKCPAGIRPAIMFNDGLNVIKGPDSFDNSIGKSSFMLVIDFCFGGEDYAKMKNIEKYVHEHDINFTFKFDDKEYHFSRGFTTPDFLTVCDENYNKTEIQWSIDNFNKWLKEMYHIDSKLTFRKIVSLFFRVYKRQNLREELPLHSHNNDTCTDAILFLIKLFDKYGPIEQSFLDAKEAEEKRKAFSNAQKYEFVPKITDANYRANIKRIDELKERKLELAYKSSNDLLEMDSTKASAISRIKSQLTIFRRQRGKLYSQIEAIQSNQKFDIASVENDFTSLEEFFPNQVNTDRLSQVESFHKTISKILKTDFDSAIKNLRDLIGLLSMQIADLENQLEEVKSASNLSKVVLDEYALIEREIVRLENENKKHDELKSLTEDKKIKVEDCETKTIEQAKIVEGLVNAEMKRLNTFIFNKDYNAPTLTILNSSNYEFLTPDDDGTGTNFKGMVMLDLACLNLTCLPTLVHDSYILKHISKPTIEKIFELYQSAGHQIFVSFDNIKSYTERTIEIIENAVVLELSGNGNELYGKKFGDEQGDNNND